MPHSSHFDQLRDAVHQERSEEALRRDRCDTFLQKVSLYQSGHGPLPDEPEFLLWREDMKKTAAIRALKAAVTLLAENGSDESRASASRPLPHPAHGRSSGTVQGDHSPL